MKEIKRFKIKSSKRFKCNGNCWFKKRALVSAKKTIFELNMKLELNELKQTHLIKALRRYIAVINTVASWKTI